MDNIQPLIYEGHDLMDVFGVLTQALDALFVIEGNKRTARIIVGEAYVGKIREFCQKCGLESAESDKKVLIEQQSGKSYSNKGLLVDKEDDGNSIFYLSKDRKDAEQAKRYDEKNEHIKLGELLGYPKCCCEFFNRYFFIESQKNNDYFLRTAENSENFNHLLNNALTCFDISLISHFPCSFSCKESIKSAEKNLDTVRKYSGSMADFIEGILKKPLVYTEEQGVHVLTDAMVDGNIVEYSQVMSSSKNQMWKMFYSGDKIVDSRFVYTGKSLVAKLDRDIIIFD